MVPVGEATALLANTSWKPRGASSLDLVARSRPAPATGFTRGASFRPTVELVPQQSEQPDYRYVLVGIFYLSPPSRAASVEAELVRVRSKEQPRTGPPPPRARTSSDHSASAPSVSTDSDHPAPADPTIAMSLATRWRPTPASATKRMPGRW
jgi:hypothetical protein